MSDAPNALPQRKTVILGKKEYELRELQFGDYADLQDLDVDLHTIADEIKKGGRLTYRQIGAMMWVCCRKRATADQPWHPTKEHFLHSFSMAEFSAASPLITEMVVGPLSLLQAESTG